MEEGVAGMLARLGIVQAALAGMLLHLQKAQAQVQQVKVRQQKVLHLKVLAQDGGHGLAVELTVVPRVAILLKIKTASVKVL